MKIQTELDIFKFLEEKKLLIYTPSIIENLESDMGVNFEFDEIFDGDETYPKWIEQYRGTSFSDIYFSSFVKIIPEENIPKDLNIEEIYFTAIKPFNGKDNTEIPIDRKFLVQISYNDSSSKRFISDDNNEFVEIK